jgi:riboflavin kinase
VLVLKKLELKNFELLFNLMLLGAKDRFITVKTSELAEILGKSQQSASVYLSKLEKEGYIQRIVEKEGTSVRLTQKGVDMLVTVYLLLRNELEEAPTTINMEGTVFSGLGEGAYYMSLDGYKEQFIKKLGFTPYPGTLNIRLDSKYIKEREKLNEYRNFGIKIDGFTNGLRTYGSLWCFHAFVEGIRGAVIIIERTHYGIDVVEIISQYNLRKELNLKDGDRVKISVFI